MLVLVEVPSVAAPKNNSSQLPPLERIAPAIFLSTMVKRRMAISLTEICG